MPNTQRIKERMTALGVSQADVAAHLGIAQPTVSQKLSGVRPFFLDEAKDLAAMLKIEAREFSSYFF